MLHVIVTKVLSNHYPRGDFDMSAGEARCHCGEYVPIISDNPEAVRIAFIKHTADLIYEIVGDHVVFARSLLEDEQYNAVKRQLDWLYDE